MKLVGNCCGVLWYPPVAAQPRRRLYAPLRPCHNMVCGLQFRWLKTNKQTTLACISILALFVVLVVGPVIGRGRFFWGFTFLCSPAFWPLLLDLDVSDLPRRRRFRPPPPLPLGKATPQEPTASPMRQNTEISPFASRYDGRWQNPAALRRVGPPVGPIPWEPPPQRGRRAAA